MTRRQLLLLSLSAAPAWAKGPLDLKRENLLIADLLDRSRADGRLYVIKPEMADSEKLVKSNPYGYFRRHPIRGQARLADADTDRLLSALSKSLRRYLNGVSLCFDPRHALRLERNGVVEAELLICFECSQLIYFSRGKPRRGYLNGGAQTFDDVAAAYGLPTIQGTPAKTQNR